ncbi:unnamed protein product, partial [Discosporangium mesarthrocarpum]
RAGSVHGVTRYHTAHGWISEHVRGSGRQPLVEVVAVGLRGEGENWPEGLTQDCDKALQTPSRRRHVLGMRHAGSKALARTHVCMKQLMTSFSRVLLGQYPRPSHREEGVHPLSVHAYAISSFIGEALLSALCDGVGESGRVGGGRLPPEAHCMHLGGVLELALCALFDERKGVLNTLLLSQMKNKGTPLRLLLDACVFVLKAALDMAGGPKRLGPEHGA